MPATKTEKPAKTVKSDSASPKKAATPAAAAKKAKPAPKTAQKASRPEASAAALAAASASAAAGETSAAASAKTAEPEHSGHPLATGSVSLDSATPRAGHAEGGHHGTLLAGRPGPKEGRFEIARPFEPSGDQPQAIEGIVQGLREGRGGQIILGATGTGKTFTLANIVQEVQRPTIVMAPNKTLAAQLYSEFRDFFPKNAVEYFVSYYDYYQPEAYVPSRDLFIEKDSQVNEQIEQMRLSATKALLERRDTLIVATVSAIYGLGSADGYYDMILSLRQGAKISRKEIISRLVKMQYERGEMDFKRGAFRAKGDVIDIFPSESAQDALRVELFDDEIESIKTIDPITGKTGGLITRFNVYPASHYATPESAMKRAVETIQVELEERLEHLRRGARLVEAQRLEQRTNFDLEMMQEIGFCKGIENYSRHLTGKKAGEPPDTLFDYLPADALLVVDESHITIPQVGAMFKGDRARKENLVDFGFRLPSAMDNRPLKFDEFESKMPQTVYLSATPADYEKERSESLVELVIRPTGILDPVIAVRPAETQIDDLLGQIKTEVAKGGRVLATSLTKRMAEKLAEFLDEHGVKAKYLHSDVENVERARLIRDLRRGVFDVLIGINLLREGLDMPEVTLVAILDADKEGFLRSERSLIQTIGRAARNPDGRVILYADKVTPSMQKAMEETERRRARQAEHNRVHGITPKRAGSAVKDILEESFDEQAKAMRGKKAARSGKKPAELIEEAIFASDPAELSKLIGQLEKEMRNAARDLHFEKAAELRDRLNALKQRAVVNPL
jgi:excinuclease ABC subunit B